MEITLITSFFGCFRGRGVCLRSGHNVTDGDELKVIMRFELGS